MKGAVLDALFDDDDELALDVPPPWRAARREVFDLLDFTRVRLELAWRDLRDQARAARAARRAAREIDGADGSDRPLEGMAT